MPCISPTPPTSARCCEARCWLPRRAPARHATALLLDQQAQHIRYRVALESGNLAPLELIAKPMMRSGLAGWVARERVAVLIADTEQDSRWLPGPGLGDLRSAIVAPLLWGTRMLGMITLGHETPSHFSNDHLRLLEVLCATVALAVEHAQVVANSASGISMKGATPDPWSAPAGAKLAPVPDDAPPRPCARTIVALSAELRGLSRMTLALPPTVLFDAVLEAYFARMDVIIRQHSGDIDSVAGDTLLAIFSRPEQAASAAIRMRESAAQLGAHWRDTLGVSADSLDIGIAGGEVAIGPLSLSHGTSRAVGPVVSVATRLRDLASGEILVAGDVAEQLHDQAFSIRALQPLRLRDGVMQPIFRVSAKL
ncbi:MAG: GAF domain-containing protein [Chloroflexota bacterium]|nr:GAF domain-containing protein [Chloroflexota bacterium]